VGDRRCRPRFDIANTAQTRIGLTFA